MADLPTMRVPAPKDRESMVRSARRAGCVTVGHAAGSAAGGSARGARSTLIVTPLFPQIQHTFFVRPCVANGTRSNAPVLHDLLNKRATVVRVL